MHLRDGMILGIRPNHRENGFQEYVDNPQLTLGSMAYASTNFVALAWPLSTFLVTPVPSGANV